MLCAEILKCWFLSFFFRSVPFSVFSHLTVNGMCEFACVHLTIKPEKTIQEACVKTIWRKEQQQSVRWEKITCRRIYVGWKIDVSIYQPDFFKTKNCFVQQQQQQRKKADTEQVDNQWPRGRCVYVCCVCTVCLERADVNQLTVDNEHAETMLLHWDLLWLRWNWKRTGERRCETMWSESESDSRGVLLNTHTIKWMQKIAAARFYTWLFVSQHQ